VPLIVGAGFGISERYGAGLIGFPAEAEYFKRWDEAQRKALQSEMSQGDLQKGFLRARIRRFSLVDQPPFFLQGGFLDLRFSSLPADLIAQLDCDLHGDRNLALRPIRDPPKVAQFEDRTPKIPKIPEDRERTLLSLCGLTVEM